MNKWPMVGFVISLPDTDPLIVLPDGIWEVLICVDPASRPPCVSLRFLPVPETFSLKHFRGCGAFSF